MKLPTDPVMWVVVGVIVALGTIACWLAAKLFKLY